MSKCKTCGKSEGFHLKQKTTGVGFVLYNSNGELLDASNDYHLNYTFLKRLRCVACGGFYGWSKDILGLE